MAKMTKRNGRDHCQTIWSIPAVKNCKMTRILCLNWLKLSKKKRKKKDEDEDSDDVAP